MPDEPNEKPYSSLRPDLFSFLVFVILVMAFLHWGLGIGA
jgi:hypothetical protein